MGANQTKPSDTVRLGHFDVLQVIGKGSFGKVRMCCKKGSRKLYALKVIDKLQCVQMHAIQNVFRERAMLEDVDHPYIVQMHYAFQDEVNLYFVLGLKTGGDMRLHLERHFGFAEDAVRIWAAEISCALQYLHRQGIVHRDIKPDNILLDAHGHAHITDFNIAISIDKGNVPILKSRSGTLPYLAPEVFSDVGYYWQVDWWSFGVTLYELIYYKRPFRDKTVHGLKKKIQEMEIKYPPLNMYKKGKRTELSTECIQFLTELLERNPFTRLGCRARQILDIREHPWLVGLNWNAVESKQLPSKYVPTEIDNFDPRVHLEEFLMDFPLKQPKAKRGEKRNTGAISPNRITKSSSGASSIIIYRSRGSTGKATAASDAALIAGNPAAMMKSYKKDSIFHFYRETQNMTEEKRVSLELQFMRDYFLPFDFSKNPTRSREAAAAETSHLTLPPVPAIPDNCCTGRSPNRSIASPVKSPSFPPTARSRTWASSSSAKVSTRDILSSNMLPSSLFQSDNNALGSELESSVVSQTLSQYFHRSSTKGEQEASQLDSDPSLSEYFVKSITSTTGPAPLQNGGPGDRPWPRMERQPTEPVVTIRRTSKVSFLVTTLPLPPIED